MQKLGESGLVSAGKDISNPGTLGTLEMLCETSHVGACVRLEAIPRNPKVNWEDWLKSYPGAAFVLTAPVENAQAVSDMLGEFEFTVAVVGEVINERCLYLESKDKRLVVFDQAVNPVL